MCERCAELEERVAWLESELGIQIETDLVNRLRSAILRRPTTGATGGRGQAADLTYALYAAKGRVMSRWQLLEAVPSPSRREDRDAKIVDVWVCVARRSLGHDTIENVWGRGYKLTDVGMARVAAILKPARTPEEREAA